MSKLIPESKKELCKFDFVFGMSQKDVARKHQVSERLIAKWSKDENWMERRRVQLDAVNPAEVAEITKKAFEKCAETAGEWRKRVEPIMDQKMDLAQVLETIMMEKVARGEAAAITLGELSEIAARNVTTMQGLAKLQQGEGPNVQVNVIGSEEARLIIERMATAYPNLLDDVMDVEPT